MRGVSVTAKRRANAAQFIRRHRRANATATNKNPNLRGVRLHRFTHQLCVIRIVVRNGTVVSAEVSHLMPRLSQLFNDSQIERVTSMISTNCNPHKIRQNPSLLPLSQQATRVLQNILDVEPELAQRNLTRRRSTESI